MLSSPIVLLLLLYHLVLTFLPWVVFRIFNSHTALRIVGSEPRSDLSNFFFFLNFILSVPYKIVFYDFVYTSICLRFRTAFLPSLRLGKSLFFFKFFFFKKKISVRYCYILFLWWPCAILSGQCSIWPSLPFWMFVIILVSIREFWS